MTTIDSLHDQPQGSFIRQQQLLEILPFSAATLWRMVKGGKFPSPVKLSERVTAWRTQHILEYLKNLEPEERNNKWQGARHA